jgi:hypothetical protein
VSRDEGEGTLSAVTLGAATSPAADRGTVEVGSPGRPSRLDVGGISASGPSTWYLVRRQPQLLPRAPERTRLGVAVAQYGVEL